MQYSYQTKRYLVRLRRILNYWPWFASVAVHAAVLAALSAIVFVSFEGRDRQAQIIPEARLGRVVGHLPLFNPPDRNDTVVVEKLLQNELAKHIAQPGDQTSFHGEMLDVIAMRQGGPREPQIADLGRFSAVAPKARFFNVYGNAYRVIYVVDISPSMIPYFTPLKRELKRCLGDLKPMQKFHVIFFSSGEPIEGPAGKLTWASDRNKRRYYEFIDGVDTGVKTDPRWAVKRALELKPDLVYLLTDGVFDRALAGQIIEWSKARKTKINTIAYVNEQGAALLRKVAEQTHGIYRFVSEGQLQWQ